MKKYVLVTVWEREISDEIFNTLEDAQKAMRKYLETELNECLENYPKVDLSQEYESSDDNYLYGYGPTYAWSNVDRHCDLDWKIIEVPFN